MPFYFHSPGPAERQSHEMINTPRSNFMVSPCGTPKRVNYGSPIPSPRKKYPSITTLRKSPELSNEKCRSNQKCRFRETPVASPNKRMLALRSHHTQNSTIILSPAAIYGSRAMLPFASGRKSMTMSPKEFPSPPVDRDSSWNDSSPHDRPCKIRKSSSTDFTKRKHRAAAFPYNKRTQVRDLMKARASEVERMSAKKKAQIKLPEVEKMIDFWQSQMNLILKRFWDQKKMHWIQQAHNLLWRTATTQKHLEKPGAEAYPQTLTLLDRSLTKDDNNWRNVLIASARVTKIVSPEFDELIYAPEGPTDPAEFEFHFGFDFGFDCQELSWIIHHALSNRTSEKALRNINLCDMIAEYVGNTKFQSEVLVYFKKSAVPWWEQDGIAKMRTWNPATKQYEDLIDFAPGEQTYYVQRWTEASVLVSDYPDTLADYFPVDEGSDPKMWRRVMQKKFIASICCQIIHTTVMVTTPPRCVGARNIMKQLSVVLKGWFIGILLGEAFSPSTLKFEYDTRGPSLTPMTIATLTQGQEA